MVVAYAQHGFGKEALELVHKMYRTEMELDHIGFIGVLAACNNSGLVNEALELFELMQERYHLAPSTKHYVCMIDAFGRAGQIEEADNFVTKMPLQPNSVSRRALLGACRNHEKMNLTDHVANQVLYFEPQEADDFVLLGNIFGADAQQDAIESRRKLHAFPGHVT
jgi:pentatricopeptide repeat protein